MNLLIKIGLFKNNLSKQVFVGIELYGSNMADA